ncbi:MAG: thermonuclease family protein [Nitrospira sp.]
MSRSVLQYRVGDTRSSVQAGFSVVILWFVTIGLPSTAATANDYSGEVITVLDGNTIDVLHNGKTERIRLYGIACPEKGQPYGYGAKDATSLLSFALEVTLHLHGKDKHGRVLADVLLADGTNVNHELVKDGWCRWYQKYAPGDAALEKLETEARQANRGLWVDPEPVPPWEWHQRRDVP